MTANKVQEPAGVYNVRTRGILPSRSCLLWLWQTGLQWLLPHLSLWLLLTPLHRYPVMGKASATWNRLWINLQPAPTDFVPLSRLPDSGSPGRNAASSQGDPAETGLDVRLWNCACNRWHDQREHGVAGLCTLSCEYLARTESLRRSRCTT